MILADKIIELRKKSGWSQEELAEKLDVSRQSISKWECAQSVPDMNRILKMSELFGVTTDYLLKDSIDSIDGSVPSINDADAGNARPVSMEEAVSFLSYKEGASKKVAVGVMMCIMSPILLIVLSSLQAGALIMLTETQAVGIGLIILLLLVGGAAALFITTGLQGQRYEYLEKEEIDTEYGVDGMVRDRMEKNRHTHTVRLVLGIVLCILSAIPLFVSMFVFGDSDMAASISAAFILLIVAFGVLVIVRTSVVWEGFQILLQEGDYTPVQKQEDSKNEHIAEIYWGLALAIYLALSFLTNDWGRTWIVWPIAGVTYGVVIAVVKAFRKQG